MSSIDITTHASPAVSTATRDDTNPAELQAFALDLWREAEAQVQAQWDAFLAAARPSDRRAAFAAYLAALDAEAVAAVGLARTHIDSAVAA